MIPVVFFQSLVAHREYREAQVRAECKRAEEWLDRITPLMQHRWAVSV